MRVLLICGDHPRHRYLLDDIIKDGKNEVIVLQMGREQLVPSSKFIKNHELKKIYDRHFWERFDLEKNVFGSDSVAERYEFEDHTYLIKISQSDLNTPLTKDAIRRLGKFDVAITMGPLILDNEFIKLLPINHFNIHLGLSPWYRGSATLLWPTYNLEPWKCGVTLHRINPETDAGEIFHQTTVEPKIEDGCQDTAIRAVTNSKTGIQILFEEMTQKKEVRAISQPFYGRTYLSSQIRPEHLWDIYVLRKNKTVKLLHELGIEPRPFKKYSIF